MVVGIGVLRGLEDVENDVGIWEEGSGIWWSE